MKVPFLDLHSQYQEISNSLQIALRKTIKRSDFILGEEEKLFEIEFAKYSQAKFAVGVNSGTDALFFALLSLGIGRGDEVIVPVFTYIATAFAVTYTGAKPIFVDINEETFNIDVHKIEKAITKKTKAIIPVDLFGQVADMQPILAIARKYNLKVIEDAAQAHGAKYRISKTSWKMAGSMGDIGCFSFYPTKNMGAFGDAGLILTSNKDIYAKIMRLRDYGRRSRYEHVSLGYNSRLDSLQAAVLRLKLRRLDSWNALRRKKAGIYSQGLSNLGNIILPQEADYARHIYHAYSIRISKRDLLVQRLKGKGIGAMVYYPIPLHLQKVYSGLGYKCGDFPVAERISQEILSLPMYPHLKERQIDFVVETIKKVIG